MSLAQFISSWFKPRPSVPMRPGLDQVLTLVSVRDDVVGIRPRHDGTVDIQVRGNVDHAYDEIVALFHRYARTAHGRVCGPGFPLDPAPRPSGVLQ